MPVLAGLFGVLKPGKTTASGHPVLRLIMDVRMTNTLLVAGDTLTWTAGPTDPGAAACGYASAADLAGWELCFA